jgi:hypothetical protein
MLLPDYTASHARRLYSSCCMLVTKTIWLMLLEELTAVYCGNHMKHINTPFGENAEFVKVKADSTYSYHCAMEG